MYYTYDNITFVASGMGNFKSDNFIIIEVLPDKSLRYRLIAINGDDEKRQVGLFREQRVEIYKRSWDTIRQDADPKDRCECALVHLLL